MLYLIYTTDQNNNIGDNNLFQKTCQEDKDWFVKVTKHHKTCFAGKNTVQTLPKVLKDRELIILDRETVPKNGIIIGGKAVYEFYLDKVDVIYRSIHKNQDFGGLKFELDFGDLVLFDKQESQDLIKEIWVRQPHKDLPISFEENRIFDLCQNQIKTELSKTSLNQQVTATVLKNLKGETVLKAQELNKHTKQNPKDTICIRETLKKQGMVVTGEYFNKNNQVICEGCLGTNHSEYLVVEEVINKELDFKGGTCYLYGHYWSCQSCQEVLKSIGISNIILDKNFVGEFLNISQF